MKKIKLFLAVLYIFSPIDIVPEAVLGPFGLLDDGAALIYIVHTLFTMSKNYKATVKSR